MVKDLLQQYIENAVIHGECTENGDYKRGNKAHDALIKSYKSLKKEDPSLKMLIPLLNHENVGVRLWSATHLLPFAEEKAIEVLKKIEEGSDFAAFGAQIIMKEWSKGTLKLDF